MALKLSKESDQGFSYNYHRISQINFEDNKIEILVKSYKSPTARETGKQHVQSVSVDINKELININESLLPQLYNQLKLQVFIDAEDC